MQYIYCMIALLLLWALYFLLHSWLASAPPKQWFRRVFYKIPFRYYRIAYNIFSLAGLIALLWFQFQLPSAMLFKHSVFTSIAGVILMAAGITVLLVAGLHYDLKSFSGITEERIDVLRKDKLNKLVRHPLYSGTTLFFFSFCMVWPCYKNLWLFIIYFTYLVIGIYLEEKKLIKMYGADYSAYRHKVKRIIPYVW